MKMKNIIGLFIFLFLIGFVSADVIFPSVTHVYFEKDGQPYNGKIDFTVNGYGYSWSPGPDRIKEPGTYTPEVVYSFSESYNNYGEKMYEHFYKNYRHIDYYELEGTMEDGETFIIKNIKEIPTSSEDVEDVYIIVDDKYYRETEEYYSCEDGVGSYTPIYGPAEDEPVGATREDWDGNIWTKQEDGMWTTPAHPATGWGDITVDLTPGGISYNRYMRDEKVCDEFLEEIPESEIEKDEMGHPVWYIYELRFNLNDAEGFEAVSPTNPLPELNPEDNPELESALRGFWESIGCFFKGLFGSGC